MSSDHNVKCPGCGLVLSAALFRDDAAADTEPDESTEAFAQAVEREAQRYHEAECIYKRDTARLDWLRVHYGAFAGACASGDGRHASQVKWRITNHEWRMDVPHNGWLTSTVEQYAPSIATDCAADLWRAAIDKAIAAHEWAIEHRDTPVDGVPLLRYEQFAAFDAAGIEVVTTRTPRSGEEEA